MDYETFVDMIKVTFAAGARREWEETRGVLTALGHKNLRTALFNLLWWEGRDKPVPISELLEGLHLYVAARRKGETKWELLRRRAENLNKVRRSINDKLKENNVPCYIELVYRSGARNLEHENGLRLELEPEKVTFLRKMDVLRKSTRGDYPRVVLRPAAEGDLRVNDPLVLSMRTPLSGYFTLFALAIDGSRRLIPDEVAGPVKVMAQRNYTLPKEVYKSVSWSLGSAGPHTLVAIVTKASQIVMVPHVLEVEERLHRGIEVKPVSIWKIPPKEMAVGCLEFTVAPGVGHN